MTIKKFTEFGSVDRKDDVTNNTLSKEELVEQAKLFNSFADNISTFNTNLKKAELFLELFESVSKDIDSLVRKEDVGTILASQLISFNSQLEEFKKSLQTANQEKISLLEDQLKTMASKAAVIWQELEEQTKDVKNTFFEKDIENQKRIDNLVKVFESLELDQVEITLSEFYKDVNQLKESVNNKLPEFDAKIQKFIIENSESIKNYINESNQLKDFVSEYFETIDKKFEELKSDNDLQNPKLETFQKQIKEYLLDIKLLKDTLKESEKTNKSAINGVLSDFEEVKTKFTETVSFVNEEADKQKKRFVESNINLDSKLESVKEFLSKLETKYEQLKENFNKSEKDIISLIEKSDTDIKQGFDQKILSTKEEFKNTITESETKTKNFVDQYHDTLHKHISTVVKDFKTQIESTNKSLNEHSVFLSSVSKDVNNIFKSEKFTKLSKKIDFLEEALEKFNEKTILNESILPQPSAKTSDPLTPLNKNFVTFEDLKKHYQLFINRIQTQLSSIGGGGAVRLDQLDDVDYRIVNATNNQVLTYVSANAKWEAKTISGGGGGDVSSVNGEIGDVVLTTANISEQGNLYYTNERVYSNVISLNYITASSLDGYTTNAQLTLYASVANLNLKANVADLTTANVAELTNLYFTNTRAVSAFTAGQNISIAANGLITSTATGGVGAVSSVNGETGDVVLTTANVAESGNLYYTNDRVYSNVQLIGYASNVYVDLRLDEKANVADLNTSNVTEGSNLYFTNTRAISAFTAGSGISLDSNGLITANVSGGGGVVLQVVSKEVTTNFATTSESFVDATDMFLAITPTSATSKIMVMFNTHVLVSRSSVSDFNALQVLRDSTVVFAPFVNNGIGNYAHGFSAPPATSIALRDRIHMQFMDSPSTTNQITYKLQVCVYDNANSGTVTINETSTSGTQVSTITLMEIAQ